MAAQRPGGRLARVAAHLAELASSSIGDLVALFGDVIDWETILDRGLGETGRVRIFSPRGDVLGVPVPDALVGRRLP